MIKKIGVIVAMLCVLNGFSQQAVAHERQGFEMREAIVLKHLAVFDEAPQTGIVVKIFVAKNEMIYGFEVSGHAGYAPKGEDIVCAGVSTVSQNTLISLKSYTADRVLHEVKPGYLKCLLPEIKNGNGSSEAVVLLKSAAMGFYLLQQSSANYLHVFKVIDES